MLRYLVISPSFGLTPVGEILPGGLETFGRCVIRALASSPSLRSLTVWSQTDLPQTEKIIAEIIKVYAHPQLEVEVKGFAGSKGRLAYEVLKANTSRRYDRMMYLHVNQSILGLLPWQAPYVVWEVGREFFNSVSRPKYMALRKAEQLLSISKSTNDRALENNSGLPSACVVHLCLEPPLFDLSSQFDQNEYIPALRERAVFILSRIAQGSLDKGHQQLIAAWPKVLDTCPDSELWIGGEGNGLPELKSQVARLPNSVAEKIHFLGYLTQKEVELRFRQCRVFAMPSRKEGFGLVFVEAARYAVPAIASSCDSVKEIVIHNESGLLVQPEPEEVAKACIALLTDDALAARLGNAANQRFLDQFTFSRFQARLLDALHLQHPEVA